MLQEIKHISKSGNKKVYLETFGCQMNILDSELIEDGLASRGYSFTNSSDDADVVLYNTCSVRALSEQKVLSRLGKLKEDKVGGRDVVVGVLGCMAERVNKDLFRKNNHVDLLVGPSKLDQIPDLLENLKKDKPKRQIALSDFRDRKGKKYDQALMEDLETLDRARSHAKANNSSQAYVRITRGCNKYCAYCVVPRTRGPEVHRHPDALINEVKRLADSGVLEVTLLGQTINHYHYADGAHGRQTSFADLLYRIHEEVPGIKRLRFMTSYPRDFTDDALDVMAQSNRICKYLHIPAQSGNDRILQRMNRGYTREIYMNLIERARSRMPELSIMGDMIVGFPSESDSDFEDSLSLLSEVQYKNIFVFKYSPRPGTVADKRDPDDISQTIKKERNNRMLAFQREISLAHHTSMIDNTYDVLVEGKGKLASGAKLTARTQGDHIVSFDGNDSLIGQIVPVKITAASELALKGNLI